MKKKAKGKDIKKSIVSFLIFVFIVFFMMLSNIKAVGVELICLRKGEVIKFSECNPSMNDFVCGSTTCQLCVNEIRKGVYCPESLNLCNEGGGSCKYLYEQQQQQNETNKTQEKLPVITLFNPVNDYYQKEAGKIEFSFKVTDSSKLEICDLILNNKSVASKNKPISLSTQRLYYTPEPGNYLWKIECKTRTGAYSKIYTIVSESREFSVSGIESETNKTEQNETESCKVCLIAPENGYTVEGEQEISFVYNISKDVNLSSINQCSLILNENIVNVSKEINSTNTFFYFVSPSPTQYSWKIECKTQQTNLTSEIRNFTINSPVLVSSPTPSSSGGGGGGCITKWNCTEWSKCIEGKQTRICSKEKDYCYAGKKLEETRNCTESSGSIATESNLESEKKEIETSSENIVQKGVRGITGAVVGVLNDNRTPIAIAFIIVIVFIVVMINYFKKEKTKDKEILFKFFL